MTTYVCTKEDFVNINKVLGIDYEIYSALYFCINPEGFNSIHNDNPANSASYPIIALNIPLVGCDDSVMYWYDSIDKSKETVMYGPSKQTPIPKLNFDNAIQLSKRTINVPTFIRIDKWHNIYNYNKTMCAKMLSVRFKNHKYFKLS